MNSELVKPIATLVLGQFCKVTSAIGFQYMKDTGFPVLEGSYILSIAIILYWFIQLGKNVNGANINTYVSNNILIARSFANGISTIVGVLIIHPSVGNMDIVSVAFVRQLDPVITSFVGNYYDKIKVKKVTILSAVIIIGGIFLMKGSGTLTMTPLGTLLLMLDSGISAGRSICDKHLVSKLKVDKESLYFYGGIPTLFLGSFFVMFNTTPVVPNLSLSVVMVLQFVLTLINYYATFIVNESKLTVARQSMISLASSLLFNTAIGVIYLKKEIVLDSIVGLGLIFIGAAVFSVSSKKEEKKIDIEAPLLENKNIELGNISKCRSI